MNSTRPNTIDSTRAFSIADTPVAVPINNRTVFLKNAGSQPISLGVDNTVSLTNGYTLNAGDKIEWPLTKDGSLYAVSNVTASTLCVMYLDI
jgi:uncharacterized protein with LGFP repeats